MSWLLQSDKNAYTRLFRHHGQPLDWASLQHNLQETYIPPGNMGISFPPPPAVIPMITKKIRQSLHPVAINGVHRVQLHLTENTNDESRKHLEAKQAFQNYIEELKMNKNWNLTMIPAKPKQIPLFSTYGEKIIPNKSGTILGSSSFSKLFDYDNGWDPELEEEGPLLDTLWDVPPLPEEPLDFTNNEKLEWSLPKNRKFPKRIKPPNTLPPMETDDLTTFAPVVESDPPWKQNPVSYEVYPATINVQRKLPSSPEQINNNWYQPLPIESIPQSTYLKNVIEIPNKAQKPNTSIKVEKIIPREIRRYYDKPWLINSKLMRGIKNKMISSTVTSKLEENNNTFYVTEDLSKTSEFFQLVPAKSRKSRKLKTMKPMRPMIHELERANKALSMRKTAVPNKSSVQKPPPFSYASIKPLERKLHRRNKITVCHTEEEDKKCEQDIFSIENKSKQSLSVSSISESSFTASTLTNSLAKEEPVSNTTRESDKVLKKMPISKKFKKVGAKKNSPVIKDIQESQLVSQEWIASVKSKKILEKKAKKQKILTPIQDSPFNFQ